MAEGTFNTKMSYAEHALHFPTMLPPQNTDITETFK